MRFFLLLLAVLGVASVTGAADIIELINSGDLTQARLELNRQVSASRRDGLLILGQALLETEGQKISQLLERASQAGVPPERAEYYYKTKAYLLLADGNFEGLLQVTEEYLGIWEAGQYREQMMFLRALAVEKNGDKASASKLKEQIIKEGASAQLSNQVRLSQSIELLAKKKFGEAQNFCRRIIKSKDEEFSAAAMYLMASAAIEIRRVDDAIHYYNLLKESYPRAIGLEELADRFESFEPRSADQKAETLTGTVYSLQTGVFSQKVNAEALAERMKKYKAPVEIVGRTISGRKYYVVYVGRFRSTDKAMEFRARLEDEEKETYQVVAR